MRCAVLTVGLIVALTAAAPPAQAGGTLGVAFPAVPAAMKEQAPAFPGVARLRAVRSYLRDRAGVLSWALIDSHGRPHGLVPRRVYVSASVVKAMLLVAYLRKIGERLPSAEERSLLGPMVTASDNDRADAIYRRLGDAALYRLARRAGMRRFSVAGYWANASINALDQARLFLRIDRLVPRRSRAYARALLSSIVPRQRWGFSRFARTAGFRTFMKGGWRRTAAGRLVHEVALFEAGGTRFSMALLTDANPSHEYGTETLRGVAKRIFRPRAEAGPAPAAAGSRAVPDEAGTEAHRRAGLVDVHRFAPGIAVELVYRTRRNLTGARLPGYCADWALLHEPAARSLGRVQRSLRRRGLGLSILDAYRPARASAALVRWALAIGRADLVGTYIARRSRHNTGAAVDLTLVRVSDGRRLRMGSGYDSLGPQAHTLSASGQVLRNRLTLARTMKRFGFAGYWREWWHFEHRVRPSRYLDLTLGC